MSAAYVESDPLCAEWLRNLIAAGAVAPGEVIEADIRDLTPNQLEGFCQVHLFAGIGVWSLALRLAGWGDDRPVWTCSCPCQPFSAAGSRAGFADDRHLWPAAHWLIAQLRPVEILGEQVAGPDGTAWFDVVAADVEALGYTCGAVAFPAAGVGAPHIRQRLWWGARRLADPHGEGRQQLRGAGRAGDGGAPGHIADGCRAHGGLGDTLAPGLAHTEPPHARGAGWNWARRAAEQHGRPPDPWGGAEWIECSDGRLRPVEPGVAPLAPRRAGDVGRLRAYGNSLAAPAAAAVIAAWMDL